MSAMTAVLFRPYSVPRRVATAAVALAYALPLALGAIANLGHGGFHLLESLRERQAEAAALGLVHLGERSTHTHTHGGVTHSHAGAVFALLVASEQADEGTSAVAPVVQLSVHVPAATAEAVIRLVIGRAASALDAFVPAHPRELPPVPPPRA
jgi:hypothetical protein